ncbi:MAG: RhuM [Parcubacteria group bacterium Athens0714_16]|nr:MAG: RhuM [Parcubacteria group bacterium Athens0714_16]
MKKVKKTKDIVVYQTKSGSIELKGDFTHETIWATQAQIVDLFGVDQSVVSRHIKNIFRDGEIEEKSNMQKMHNANSDKPITLYSLDVILGIGYRTNSRVAIEFRKWATKTLRQYIVDGYVINKKQIAKNYTQFQKAVENIKHSLPASSSVDHASMIELISAFANTWLSLDAYDKSYLPQKGATKKRIVFVAQELFNAFSDFKKELTKKNLAGDLFGQERVDGSIEGIVGSIFQSFDKKDLYPTVEEKAAHILYFIVKNHPLVDGNKRTGAYAFIWFLKKAGILNLSKLTPPTLTALTLFVADSNSRDKDSIEWLYTKTDKNNVEKCFL